MVGSSSNLLNAAPAILEASSEAIATIDGAGHIMGANRRFHLLLNVTADECEQLDIYQLFQELDFHSSREYQDVYEPTQLTKPDGTRSLVLVKLIAVGKEISGYQTILIQDPEAIRRIIDRLDYIDSFDVSTALYNRRKGLVEFEQLQASDLRGGCFLIRLDYDQDDTNREAGLAIKFKHLASRFRTLGDQQITCRYSISEFLFVFSAEKPVPRELCREVLNVLKGDISVLTEEVWLAFQGWRGMDQPVKSVIDQLRSNLILIGELRDFGDCRFADEVVPQVSLLDALKSALDDDQFQYYIQPQISSETRQVEGGELLVRWIPSPEQIIPPSRFVDFLEEGEFADRFLSWSIRRTAEILSQIKEATGHWVTLSLNVAPTQFVEGLLVNSLLEVFREFEIPTQYLEVEITERVLADNPQEVLGVLRKLQYEGFKIAIDDFGTGYSSLSYLRQFPLDRLKIDRVFVTNLAENEEDRLISTAIASLAHVLGLEVVVEGIEEPAQASFLQNIGCEYFQGFLTGKPMPIDDFIRFYQHQKQDISWMDATLDLSHERHLDPNNRKVSWKKSFSTDIVSIDNEHRDLVDALNHFTEVYLHDPEQVNYLDTLDLIGSETIKHFDHEEQVMRNIAYPRYEMHKEKHKWLIADLSKRRAEVAANPGDTDFDEILKYLKYWLLRHLISEDTHLHRYINKSSTERRVT